jgi:hypothetical protein
VTDLVLFAGPVIVGPEFRSINWLGRDVRIVPIEGHGSTHFVTLALQHKDAQGRILPGLLRRYTPRDIAHVDKVALAAYSAGWGLLDQVGRSPEDRERLSAMILSDACFGGGKRGYEAFAPLAAAGDKLMVATTAHTTPGSYPSGRESWEMVWQAAEEATGKRTRLVSPKQPVPPASGGWKQLGSRLLWGDYTEPGSKRNQGNDLSHADHHWLAPEVWQAYLAPWLAGRTVPWFEVGAGLAVGAAAGVGGWLLRS